MITCHGCGYPFLIGARVCAQHPDVPLCVQCFDKTPCAREHGPACASVVRGQIFAVPVARREEPGFEMATDTAVGQMDLFGARQEMPRVARGAMR